MSLEDSLFLPPWNGKICPSMPLFCPSSSSFNDAFILPTSQSLPLESQTCSSLISEKQCRRIIRLCLPINVRHCYSPERQSLLFMLLNHLRFYQSIKEEVFPHLIEFLEKLDVHDPLWLNCCECGFGYNFLNTIFRVIGFDETNCTTIKFIVERIHLLVRTLHQTFSGVTDEVDELEGVLSPMSTLDKSRAIMLQELLHAVTSAHAQPSSQRIDSRWIPHYQSLAECVRTIVSISAPFTNPVLACLALRALNVGHTILTQFSLGITGTSDENCLTYEQEIFENLLEGVAFIHSSEPNKDNLHLFKASLLLLVELNKYTSDLSLMTYTAEMFVKYIDFYPLSLDKYYDLGDVNQVMQLLISVFKANEQSDGLLIVASSVSKFLVRMISNTSLDQDSVTMCTSVFEKAAIILDMEYQLTQNPTSACCNTISLLFDIIQAELVSKEELCPSVGLCVDILSIFTKTLRDKAIIIGSYKELIRLTQLPIYHEPVIVKKFICHILDIGSLVNDKKCANVVVFHILHLMEECVTSIVQLLLHLVFDRGNIECNQRLENDFPSLTTDGAKQLIWSLTKMSQEIECFGQCLAACYQHSSSKMPDVKRHEEWSRRLIDMVATFVKSIFKKQHFDTIYRRCPQALDYAFVCVQSMLEPIILFKYASLPFFQHNDSKIVKTSGTSKPNKRRKVVDDNIMTIRLWLSLFLIFVRSKSKNCAKCVAKGNSDILNNLLLRLAYVSPPVVFGSLLSTFGDSKKKYDIIDEVLISDSTISDLVTHAFASDDVDWIRRCYLDDLLQSNPIVDKQRINTRRYALIQNRKLSNQQYLYFIGVVHFLESSRIDGSLDCRTLLYYLQDIPLCTKLSYDKKEIMTAVVEDVMHQWLNKAFSHFLNLEKCVPDIAQPDDSNSCFGCGLSVSGDEKDFCVLIQCQLLSLLERCIDRRPEVRQLASEMVVDALHQLRALSKLDNVLAADGHRGILGLIEIVDSLQDIRCNIAYDAVASLPIESREGTIRSFGQRLQFSSLLPFPEISFPLNQNEFCICCEELLFVTYIWLGCTDLSSATIALSTALQDRSTSSLVKEMFEEMIGCETPVYHLTKTYDITQDTSGNSDTIKILRREAAKRAANYRVNMFSRMNKKKSKLSFLSLSSLSGGAVRKYYKHLRVQQQRHQQENGMIDNNLGKLDGDIRGAEKLLHLLTTRYGTFEPINGKMHPLRALLRQIGSTLIRESSAQTNNELEYVYEILAAVVRILPSSEFKQDLLYALQMTECIFYADLTSNAHHRQIAVIQLWHRFIQEFENDWMMISLFALNALTTFLGSKFDNAWTSCYQIICEPQGDAGFEKSSLSCFVLKHATEMLKCIVFDKRMTISQASHNYHIIRTSIATFLASWSNYESAVTSFSAASPLSMMKYNCKVSLCQVAFEVLRQSHGANNEMTIACNRIFREQLLLSVCFLLQSINEEVQRTANDFLYQFSSGQQLHEQNNLMQRQWKEHAENGSKECLEWIQILVALIEDSKRWKLEYDVQELEDFTQKQLSTRMSTSTASCHHSVDWGASHQPGLDLCMGIYGVAESHRKPVLFVGFDAFNNQVLSKLGKLPSSLSFKGHSSKASDSADKKQINRDPIDESFFAKLLESDIFSDALRRQRSFGVGSLIVNGTEGLKDSGIFMLLYVLIHHRLDQLISRYAIAAINSSSSYSLGNHHTEDIERIRNALTTLQKMETKQGLPSVSSYYGQKDVKLYKQAIKTAWSLSPKLALLLKECFFELIGEQDGRRKGMHTLALFLKLSYGGASNSRLNNGILDQQDWRMIYPILDLALSTKNIKSTTVSFEKERALALQVLDTLPPAPLYVLLGLLSRCTLYLAGQDAIMSLSSLVSTKTLIPTVVRFVVRSLYNVTRDDVLFYLPQLVQLLRVDEFGFIRDFLRYQAESSPLVCHQLLWCLQTESQNTTNMAATVTHSKYGYCKSLSGVDPLVLRSDQLLMDLTSPTSGILSPLHLKYMVEQISFFNALTTISETLKSIKNKEFHPKAVKEKVQNMRIPKGLYLPTNPMKQVVSIDIDSASPMQSAAKCPYLLKLVTKSWGGPDNYLTQLIKQREESKLQVKLLENVKDDLLVPISTVYPNPKRKMMVSNPMSPFRTTSQRILEVESSENKKSKLSKKKNVEFGKNVKSTPSLDAMKFEEALEKEKVEENQSVADFPPQMEVGKNKGSELNVRVPLRSRKLYRNPRLNQNKAMSENHVAGPNSGVDNDGANNKGIGRREVGFTSPKVSFRKNNVESSSPMNASFTTPKKTFVSASFSPLPLSVGDEDIPPSIHQYSFSGSMQDKSTNQENDENDICKNAKLTVDACIFKVFDDCRQDVITLQVIRLLRNWFALRSIPVYLMPYNIISNRTGASKALGGILEVVPNVMSRDQIGKAGIGKSLKQFYLTKFGPEGSEGFRTAQLAFASSLAAYSVVCYILHIKDRHNGNILIDEDGHLIHIDYGFILGISPGKNLGFEVAPFKLSKEMVELMGGICSEIYHKYCNLTVQCFLAAREIMLSILSTVVAYADSDLPCFQYKENVLRNLKSRFVPELTDVDAAFHMKKLIDRARENWTTGAYDGVQKLQNNIFSEEWR